MAYHKIEEIRECFGEENVNKNLKEGFQLLKILQSRSIIDDHEETRPCYILGFIPE